MCDSVLCPKSYNIRKIHIDLSEPLGRALTNITDNCLIAVTIAYKQDNKTDDDMCACYKATFSSFVKYFNKKIAPVIQFGTVFERTKKGVLHFHGYISFDEKLYYSHELKKVFSVKDRRYVYESDPRINKVELEDVYRYMISYAHSNNKIPHKYVSNIGRGYYKCYERFKCPAFCLQLMHSDRYQERDSSAGTWYKYMCKSSNPKNYEIIKNI